MFLLALSAAAEPVPVVVELFTSEGCSSCPPADALLSAIRKSAPEGVEILALSEHVDYWNQLGWRDPFSSAQFTERQQSYARRFGIRGPYTPQVVDGQWEFVGSDRARLAAALASAAGRPKGHAQVTAGAGEIVVTLPDGARGEAWLAITEDGLSTEVKRGENGGRMLRHDAVVRRMTKLGKGATHRVAWKAEPEWKRGTLRAVVFVTGGGGAVVAAGSTPLP
jgi:hypothetical protein